MPGITPKCLECGADLWDDPVHLVHECPVCRPVERLTTEKVRESLMEAA